jgi:hypothetical protein
MECADYCSAAMTSCKGAQAIYASEADCLAVCSDLPPSASSGSSGGAGMMANDSVQCRMKYAAAAKSDSSFCPLLGPESFGGCSDDCTAYCDLEMVACPGIFATRDACLADCGKLNGTAHYTSTSQQSGVSFACWMYWLTQAAADASLCPNTAFASATCRVDSLGTCDACLSDAATTNSGKCSAQYKACVENANSPCSQCYTCASACNADQACIAQCHAANPNGCAEYDNVLNCVFCDQCQANGLCATQQMQIPWVCK